MLYLYDPCLYLTYVAESHTSPQPKAMTSLLYNRGDRTNKHFILFTRSFVSSSFQTCKDPRVNRTVLPPYRLSYYTSPASLIVVVRFSDNIVFSCPYNRWGGRYGTTGNVVLREKIDIKIPRICG